MTGSYIKLLFKDIPDSCVDDLTYELFEMGAQGVSENLKFIQTSQQYDPEIIKQDKTSIEAFFLIEALESLESLSTNPRYQSFQMELIKESSKDWLLEWKKHYSPFCVIDNLWVYPSWEKGQIKENQEVILVDPGLAFGTGTHATTELCLKALSESLVEGHGYETALDMGAGTGILSVLIQKRNVPSILACEIDEMAREKCRENLLINECGAIQICGPDELGKNKFDLVVANIIDGVLLKIKKDLVAKCSKKLILSGILLENEKEVTQAFLDEGLHLSKRSQKDEWACLEFLKDA